MHKRGQSIIEYLLIAILVILGIVYIVQPEALTPWKEVAVNAGKATANVVQSTGESVNKAVRDEAHKDSMIEKSKDRFTDAVTGK